MQEGRASSTARLIAAATVLANSHDIAQLAQEFSDVASRFTPTHGPAPLPAETNEDTTPTKKNLTPVVPAPPPLPPADDSVDAAAYDAHAGITKVVFEVNGQVLATATPTFYGWLARWDTTTSIPSGI